MKNNIYESEVFEYGKVYEFFPEMFEEDIGFYPRFHKTIGFQKRFMYKGKGSDNCFMTLKIPIIIEGKRLHNKYYDIRFFIHREWCKEVR